MRMWSRRFDWCDVTLWFQYTFSTTRRWLCNVHMIKNGWKVKKGENEWEWMIINVVCVFVNFRLLYSYKYICIGLFIFVHQRAQRSENSQRNNILWHNTCICTFNQCFVFAFVSSNLCILDWCIFISAFVYLYWCISVLVLVYLYWCSREPKWIRQRSDVM